VWWGSAIEIRSGIARLHRLAEIDDYGNHQALQAMESLRRAWREIHPTEAVRNRSFTVLDAYPLRAADSLQLAAALIWCDERPAGKTFLSADIRLCEAAAKSGFTVLIP
jgi:predicted nucleic acid-binding protein